MADLNDAARAAIEVGHRPHLTTLNPDGSPQTTVVWAGMDGDRIVVASLAERAKVRNARRDPRVSLSLLTGGTTNGLDDYLVVEGAAEVVAGGADTWLQHLARRYMGPDAVFPPPERSNPGFRMLITPTRVRGNGPW